MKRFAKSSSDNDGQLQGYCYIAVIVLSNSIMDRGCFVHDHRTRNQYVNPKVGLIKLVVLYKSFSRRSLDHHCVDNAVKKQIEGNDFVT